MDDQSPMTVEVITQDGHTIIRPDGAELWPMQVGTSPIFSKVGECGGGDFVNLLQLSLTVAVMDGNVCAASTLPTLRGHVLGWG